MTNGTTSLSDVLSEGIALKEGRQYEQALQRLHTYLEHHPDNHQALVAIAECHQSLGRMRRAVEFFQKALRVNPNDAHVMAKAGYAMHYLDPQQRAEGKTLLERALAAQPDSPEVLTIVGEIMIAEDPSRAKPLIDRALSLCPQSARTLFSKGMLYEQESNIAEAVAFYARASSADPYYRNVLYAKVDQICTMHRHKDALQELESLLAFDSNTARYHRTKGKILADQSRWDEAIDSYTKALDLEPADPVSLLGRGRAYSSCECWAEAQRDYEGAVRADPRCAEALTNLAAIYCDVHEEYERALEYVKQALDANKDLVKAWVNRGIILRHLGRLQDAVDSYDHALSLEPRNAFALLRKGAMLTDELGLYDEALQCFNEAAKVAPENPECWWNLSQVYMHKEDFETAVAQIDKLLELEPDNMAARGNKAALLQRLGRGAEAAAVMAQAGPTCRSTIPEGGSDSIDSEGSSGAGLAGFMSLFQSFADTQEGARRLLQGLAALSTAAAPEARVLALLRHIVAQSDVAKGYIHIIAQKSDALLATVFLGKLAELMRLAALDSP
jgi:tetratricopeptide (TPR) repeat protein